MFIAQLKVKRDAKTYTYHRLMESVRTPKGPRQRLIMSLGALSIPKAQWPVLAERIQDFLTHQRVIPYGFTEGGPPGPQICSARTPQAAASICASHPPGTDQADLCRSM